MRRMIFKRVSCDHSTDPHSAHGCFTGKTRPVALVIGRAATRTALAAIAPVPLRSPSHLLTVQLPRQVPMESRENDASRCHERCRVPERWEGGRLSPEDVLCPGSEKDSSEGEVCGVAVDISPCEPGKSQGPDISVPPIGESPGGPKMEAALPPPHGARTSPVTPTFPHHVPTGRMHTERAIQRGAAVRMRHRD